VVERSLEPMLLTICRKINSQASKHIDIVDKKTWDAK